jgi:uncharacterized membrane protein YgdD (TMEM256/DUF423 family)
MSGFFIPGCVNGRMQKNLGIAACLFGACAVALGAFGAHALREHLDAASLQIWHTAVEYQFWHALALLAIAGFAPPNKTWRIAGVALIVGCVLFSGSLYALALGSPRWTGIVTPFGGLALILGWCAAAIGFWRSAKEKNFP